MVATAWRNLNKWKRCRNMSCNSSAFLVCTVHLPEARQNLQSGSLGPVYCDYYLYSIQNAQSLPFGHIKVHASKSLQPSGPIILLSVTSKLCIFQSCYCYFHHFIAYLSLPDCWKFWSTVMRKGSSASL